MERAYQRYLRHHRAEGSTPNTIAYHRNSIGLLLRFLRERGHSLQLADFTADDVRDWLDEQRSRNLAQKTLRTRVVSLKAWAHWLVAEELLDRDPLAKLKRPKADDKPRHGLTPEEVDALLAATANGQGANPARDRAMLVILFSTGLRATELLSLEYADLDYEKGLIMVQRGKGGKFRQVPLAPIAERALDRYLDHPKRPKSSSQRLFLTQAGTPLQYMGLRMVFHRLGQRAGIDAAAHLLRHGGAIQYLRNGGKLETLKLMLGHSTLDMTLHYARLAGIDLAEAHERADPARSLRRIK